MSDRVWSADLRQGDQIISQYTPECEPHAWTILYPNQAGSGLVIGSPGVQTMVTFADFDYIMQNGWKQWRGLREPPYELRPGDHPEPPPPPRHDCVGLQERPTTDGEWRQCPECQAWWQYGKLGWFKGGWAKA